MSKKNKPKSKPAVGSPAAGSNNKREKTNQPKQKKQPVHPEKAPWPAKQVKEKAVKKEKPVREKRIKKERPAKIKPLNNKAVVIAAASVLIAALVVVVVLVAFGNPSLPDSVKNAEFKGRLEPDSVAAETRLSEAQQEKLSKSVKARGSTGAFDFYVNDEISVQEHTDPVLMEFGNNSSNDCVLVAFLLDENGEVIYRSLGVEPGEEIRSVMLFDAVSYGTQTATLVVNGYDARTYEKTGTQTVKIKLKIGVDTVEE